MKRIIVLAAASLYLCAEIASAQQTQQAPPAQQTQSGQSGASDQSGMSAGQSGAAGQPGAAGQSGAPAAPGTSGASGAAPPVAGKTTLGVTVVEMDAIILGWSARKDLLGKAVINDAKEKIGEIEDVIITPDKAASFAIIGVGGFLGIGERQVAIPFQQFRMQEGRLVLPGATREALKALPEFKYARR